MPIISRENSRTARIFSPIIGVIRLTSPLWAQRNVAKFPIAKNTPTSRGCHTSAKSFTPPSVKSDGMKRIHIETLLKTRMEVGESFSSLVASFTRITLRL